MNAGCSFSHKTRKHIPHTWSCYVWLEKSDGLLYVCPVSLRENEDASDCAVPVSTSLIKQFVNKTGNEDDLQHILADFYGPKPSSEPPWPYVTKDTDRYT